MRMFYYYLNTSADVIISRFSLFCSVSSWWFVLFLLQPYCSKHNNENYSRIWWCDMFVEDAMRYDAMQCNSIQCDARCNDDDVLRRKNSIQSIVWSLSSHHISYRNIYSNFNSTLSPNVFYIERLHCDLMWCLGFAAVDDDIWWYAMLFRLDVLNLSCEFFLVFVFVCMQLLIFFCVCVCDCDVILCLVYLSM